VIDHDKTINIYWWDMQIQATWCSGEWDTSGYSDCIKMRISHPEIYQLLCVEQAMIYQYIYIYHLPILPIYISYIYIICIWCIYIYICMIYPEILWQFSGDMWNDVYDCGSFRLPADFPRPHRTGIEAYFWAWTAYIYIYIYLQIYTYTVYTYKHIYICIYIYIYMYIYTYKYSIFDIFPHAHLRYWYDEIYLVSVDARITWWHRLAMATQKGAPIDAR